MQFYCQNTIPPYKDTNLCLPYTCWKMKQVGIRDRSLFISRGDRQHVKLNSEKTWKLWKKSKLNSEKIGKIWKKAKLNSEMIWKIWKKKQVEL